MKFAKTLKIIFMSFLITFLHSCEEKNCPEDMVECKLNNDTEICVPEHIGC